MITVINVHTFKDFRSTLNIVNIGRGTIFGNPYTHLPLSNTKAEIQVKTRTEAINSYEKYMRYQYENNNEYKQAIDKLIELNKKGEDIYLACYCVPKSCHGNVIKKFIEEKSINGLW